MPQRINLNIVRPMHPSIDEFADDFQAALRSGMVTNQSPWVRSFEKLLSDYIGVRYCAAMVNGETALLLMLRALDIKGSVLVPSYTFSGTVHALMWNNLTPIFVDIDRNTLTMDCDDLTNKIQSDSSAIMPVPMYGNPCDNDKLEEISSKYNLKLIFDSAPAFGSSYKGRKLGSFGTAEALSFHATKVLSTMEGGAVATNDEELYQKICALRNFGQVAECECSDFGLNGKMMEICALIGIKNLPKLENWVVHRNKLVDRFFEKLKGLKGIYRQEIREYSVSNHLYLFVLIDPDEFGMTRDKIIEKLAGENITARRFFCNPVHTMLCYKNFKGIDLPNTEYASRNGLSLPLYSDMTFNELDRISDVFIGLK